MSVHSANLGLRYGCQAPNASAGEPSLELTLPPEAVNAPAGRVDIELDYPNVSGLKKQRFTFARTQGGPASICLPLIHASGVTKHLVVVVLLDHASGWVGATAVEIGATSTDR